LFTTCIILTVAVFQAITPPDSLYPLQLSLPHDVIYGGKLSSLQLEGVIQAVSITLQTHISWKLFWLYINWSLML